MSTIIVRRHREREICNLILLFIAWVRSNSKMLPYVKFAEDKVLVVVILREKCENNATLSLSLIITLIFIAEWSDKSKWYCPTAHCCQINLI